MPGMPQTSSSGSVGATLVGASALRQPQVDPELERLSSRGVALPPGANWQANYAAHPHSGDTTRLLPNKDSNYDPRTQTGLAARNNTITPMPIWGLNQKDKRHVHFSPLGFTKVQLPLTNFASKVPQPKRRLTADENFMWELAHFLEGHTAAWLSRPAWNDPPYEIGHFLTRIGRHDESNPDPRGRRKAVAKRVKIDSAGWIRVRDLLERDRAGN